MSTTANCPNCKLLNPPGARLCDCGYDFRTHAVEAPPTGVKPDDSLLASARWLILGAALVAKVVLFAAGADVVSDAVSIGLLLLALVGFWEKRRRHR